MGRCGRQVKQQRTVEHAGRHGIPARSFEQRRAVKLAGSACQGGRAALLQPLPLEPPPDTSLLCQPLPSEPPPDTSLLFQPLPLKPPPENPFPRSQPQGCATKNALPPHANEAQTNERRQCHEPDELYVMKPSTPGC